MAIPWVWRTSSTKSHHAFNSVVWYGRAWSLKQTLLQMHAIILVYGAYPHLHTYVSFFNYLFLSCGRPERCVWQPGGDIRELLRGQPEYRMANRGRGRQARSPGMAELRTRDLWHSWSGRSLHGPSLLLVSRWALATDLKQTSAEQYPPGPGYCTMAYLTKILPSCISKLMRSKYIRYWATISVAIPPIDKWLSFPALGCV